MATATMNPATTTAPGARLTVATDRATLARALAKIAIPNTREHTVPAIARGVLPDGRDGQLSLTTTDMETTATVRVPDVVRTGGRLLLDHDETTKLLAALVKGRRKREADTAPVTIRATDGGAATLEVAGGYSMPVTTYARADFPAPPTTPHTVAQVRREDFTAHARRVLVASGTDCATPVVTGVHVRITPGALALACTDRYRLAVAELDATTTAKERSLLFPARLLCGTLKHIDGDHVRVGLDDAGNGERVSLASGDLTIVTRPVPASFPDYEALFPSGSLTVWARRSALADATERAAAALDAKRHSARGTLRRQAPAQVVLTIDPSGTVSIAPVVDEHADAVTAPAHAAQVDGARKSVRVLFAASHVREALKTLDGETATIELTTPNRPALFTSADTAGYRHLLMRSAHHGRSALRSPAVAPVRVRHHSDHPLRTQIRRSANARTPRRATNYTARTTSNYRRVPWTTLDDAASRGGSPFTGFTAGRRTVRTPSRVGPPAHVLAPRPRATAPDSQM